LMLGANEESAVTTPDAGPPGLDVHHHRANWVPRLVEGGEKHIRLLGQPIEEILLGMTFVPRFLGISLGKRFGKDISQNFNVRSLN
ncbi:MAG: hypothetical protein AAB907_00395, partial [Patescibacteria group bacterium]